MKRTIRILPLVIVVAALAGCSNAQSDAENAAVAFAKASTGEACSMYAGRDAESVTQCEQAAATQNVQDQPYNEADYQDAPHVTKTQERGEGYAVLVESTKKDGTVAREVIGVVPEGDSWKVDESMSMDNQTNEDLCYYIGGDCK